MQSKTSALLVQVTTSNTDINVYLGAVNYAITLLPNGAVKTTLTTALSLLGITLTAAGGITDQTLAAATPALTAAGILPLKVTAAALAVCTTDTIPAGTYPNVGVALAGAPAPTDAAVRGPAL